MGNERIEYEVRGREVHSVLGSIVRVEAVFGGGRKECVVKVRRNVEIEEVNRRIGWFMGKQNHPSCNYVIKKIYGQESKSTGMCGSLSQQ